MVKKLNWILVLVLLLGLSTLACGVFGGDAEEATAVPAEAEAPAPEAETETVTEEESVPEAETTTEEETAVEEPAATDEASTNSDAATDTGEAPALSASALELPTADKLPFDSARMVMTLEFNGVKADGEEIIQAMNADFAFSSEPPSSSMSVSMTGVEDEMMGDGTIEIVHIEGTTYMVLPEMGCITTQGEADNMFADMFAPDEFLQNVGDARYEGEETINGIRTLHYSFDETALGDTGDEEVEAAEGHIYIAKDGGFLVRMVMDATGNIDFIEGDVEEGGSLHIEMDLTNVDEPVEIVKPSGCEAGAAGGGSELPQVDDATDVTSFPGMTSYLSSMTTEDILVFYDDALSAEGWVKNEAESIILGTLATIIYTRDNETLNLTITPDEASGDTYVIMMSEVE